MRRSSRCTGEVGSRQATPCASPSGARPSAGRSRRAPTRWRRRHTMSSARTTARSCVPSSGPGAPFSQSTCAKGAQGRPRSCPREPNQYDVAFVAADIHASKQRGRIVSKSGSMCSYGWLATNSGVLAKSGSATGTVGDRAGPSRAPKDRPDLSRNAPVRTSNLLSGPHSSMSWTPWHEGGPARGPTGACLGGKNSESCQLVREA